MPVRTIANQMLDALVWQFEVCKRIWIPTSIVIIDAFDPDLFSGSVNVVVAVFLRTNAGFD